MSDDRIPAVVIGFICRASTARPATAIAALSMFAIATNAHSAVPLVNDSPRSFSCSERYDRAGFHRIARRAYDGKAPATRFERVTLLKVVRCQRAPHTSRPIIRRHRVRYRNLHLHGLAVKRYGPIRAVGYTLMRRRGLTGQWPCLDALVYRESRWDPSAYNSSSGAYGLPQSLPGAKMASAGADWQTNPRTQLRWMLGYVRGRYGGACSALAHSNSVGWY